MLNAWPPRAILGADRAHWPKRLVFPLPNSVPRSGLFPTYGVSGESKDGLRENRGFSDLRLVGSDNGCGPKTRCPREKKSFAVPPMSAML